MHHFSLFSSATCINIRYAYVRVRDVGSGALYWLDSKIANFLL